MKIKTDKKVFIISDEHYYHFNILKYDNRPFKNLEDMHESMIARHNSVVGDCDLTIHLGDFCMSKKPESAQNIIKKLNGEHIFVKGSHDNWLPDNHPERYELNYNGKIIILDHYQGKTWPRSHHGSFQFYGHSHGKSVPGNNQMEVFCGHFDYKPVSLDYLINQLKEVRK